VRPRETNGTYHTPLLALRGISIIGSAALQNPCLLPVAVMNYCVRSVVEEKVRMLENFACSNSNINE
jgi:hypothetical protein